jgi:hypothetical protein
VVDVVVGRTTVVVEDVGTTSVDVVTGTSVELDVVLLMAVLDVLLVVATVDVVEGADVVGVSVVVLVDDVVAAVEEVVAAVEVVAPVDDVVVVGATDVELVELVVGVGDVVVVVDGSVFEVVVVGSCDDVEVDEVVGTTVDVDEVVGACVVDDVVGTTVVGVADVVEVVVGRMIVELDDVVVGRMIVELVDDVVGTTEVELDVVEVDDVVVVVGNGHCTPQHARFGFWISTGGGDAMPVMTGGLVRHDSSLMSVAMSLPPTVRPVLAARMFAPDGLPPGPVAMSSPVAVMLIWQASRSKPPPEHARVEGRVDHRLRAETGR